MSDELVAALARAQKNFQPIVKSHTADAGKYTYTYANLADTLAAVVPALNEEGIVLLQPMQWTESGVELQTVLLGHGGRLTSSLPLSLDNLPAQEAGKLISYMRRYLATSFLGLAADDDDAAANTTVKYRSDGSQSAPRGTQRPTAREMDARPGKPLEDGSKPCSDAQRNFIADLADKQGWSPDERTLVFKKIAGIVADPMTSATAKALIPELKRIAKRELVVEWDAEGNPQVVTAVEAAIADGEEPF